MAKKPRLVKLPPEVIVDYLCPQCGAPMSSGIRDPEGDYSDWFVKPHCTECDYEAPSSRYPYEDCKKREE